MPVEVDFHSETYGPLFEDVLTEFPTLLDDLKRDFTRYIESDRSFLPSYFGQDAPYVEPYAAQRAQLMHIHICLPPREFQRGVPQAFRKCRYGEPERDAALVYVQGELYEDRFLLLAFLYPGAHEKARERQTMQYLARLAQNFRDMN